MCQAHLEKQGSFFVASLSGELILGCTSEIKEQVKNYAETNQLYRLVVDLSDVSFIDSSGLGALLAWFKMANQQQGTLVFCGMADHVRKVVGYAKLDKIFTIVDTMDEAKAMM